MHHFRPVEARRNEFREEAVPHSAAAWMGNYGGAAGCVDRCDCVLSGEHGLWHVAGLADSEVEVKRFLHGGYVAGVHEYLCEMWPPNGGAACPIFDLLEGDVEPAGCGARRHDLRPFAPPATLLNAHLREDGRVRVDEKAEQMNFTVPGARGDLDAGHDFDLQPGRCLYGRLHACRGVVIGHRDGREASRRSEFDQFARLERAVGPVGVRVQIRDSLVHLNSDALARLDRYSLPAERATVTFARAVDRVLGRPPVASSRA
jgi:hypothetical protein